MIRRLLNLPMTALGIALTLAACSPSADEGDPGDIGSTPATTPADAGRGVMLNARVDAAQAALGQAVASGARDQAAADRLAGELTAIREDLSAALARDPGPVPRAERQALSERLARVEEEVAAPRP
jgi:hypothetical protein